MPTREDENPELNPLCGGDPLARRLAVLQPLPAGLDQNRLLYAAGSVARDRDVAFWRRLAIGQGAALCTLFGIGLVREVEFGPRGDATNGARSPIAEQAPPPAAARTNAPPPQQAPQPAAPSPEASVPGAAGFARGADAPERGETAKWLQLRADIFAAGLGVLPTPHAPPPRADATALEKSLQLPPGVLASPYSPPKAKPPENNNPE